jgi:hypothetical protein
MHVGLIFPSYSRPGRPFHPIALHLHLLSASLSRLCHFMEPLKREAALKRLIMVPAAGENRGLPALSIVGSFFLLPSLESVAGSVAPPDCHRALGAVRAPLVAMRVDAQSDNRLATTPDGPRGVGTAVLWPRYVLQELPVLATWIIRSKTSPSRRRKISFPCFQTQQGRCRIKRRQQHTSA